MKRRTAVIIAMGALFGLQTPAALSQNKTINLMAGPAGSTSMKVSQDIADLARECGLDPRVEETQGGLDNLIAVKERSYTQFGIVQNDVIDYLRSFETIDPAIANTMRGIHLAFPLYSEEVHVVADKSITGIEDLAGKRVSIGAPNSDTFLTATVMLKVLSVQPEARVTLGPEDALTALRDGQIDAFFFVDGAPSDVFEGQSIDPERFHLVEITNPLLTSIYETSTLDAGTYPFTPDPIEMLKVGSVMITFNYVPRGKNRYNTYNCRVVSDLTRLVHDNIADLATIGHPKWIEVNPGGEVEGLELSRCVEIGLEPDYELSCR